MSINKSTLAKKRRERCMIVGAGDGLGKSLAKVFAQDGCDLVLVGRSSERCMTAQTAAVRAAAEASVQVIAANAEYPDELESILAAAGEIDVLIYNVRGRAPMGEPLTIQQADLESVLRLEVGSALAAAKAVLPAMLSRGHGCLIFSSATAAFRGSSGYPLYSIGKFGLRALTQSLAKAYGPRGVHVAQVRLDCTLDTPLMRELMPDAASKSQLADPDVIARAYCQLYRQPKEAWSNEVELRPYTEMWTIKVRLRSNENSNGWAWHTH